MNYKQQPTKENILLAHKNGCEAVRKTLETLYPDLFEGVEVPNAAIKGFLLTSLDGDYKGKGFYLNDSYDWEIVKDCNGELILVPTKKHS